MHLVSARHIPESSHKDCCYQVVIKLELPACASTAPAGPERGAGTAQTRQHRHRQSRGRLGRDRCRAVQTEGRHRHRAGQGRADTGQHIDEHSTSRHRDSLPYSVRNACPRMYSTRQWQAYARICMGRGAVAGGLVSQSPLPPCASTCWQACEGRHRGAHGP